MDKQTKDELIQVAKNHMWNALSLEQKESKINRLDKLFNGPDHGKLPEPEPYISCGFIGEDERQRMFDEDMNDMGDGHPGHPNNFGNQ